MHLLDGVVYSSVGKGVFGNFTDLLRGGSEGTDCFYMSCPVAVAVSQGVDGRKSEITFLKVISLRLSGRFVVMVIQEIVHYLDT